MIHTTGNVHAPIAPTTVQATGLSPVLCRDILLKTMFRQNLATASDIASALCILPTVATELVEMGRGENLVETLGTTDAPGSTELRYQLTESGRARAVDALAQSEHYGALPVTLDAYRAQTERQSINAVTISRDRLMQSMSHLVLPDGLLDRLGPAVNSGRSVLLYGPPGNGKSSIASGIRDALGDKIFVPKTIEYAGQIIGVYDPIIHTEAVPDHNPNALRRVVGHDPRYVLCDRPTVMTGGELTLEMLDLTYNAVSRTYQAPLQLKAAGGVFIVDDLGRQQDAPQALINRWIVPMENGIDILALQSGEKCVVPFDTLVIFSTNFAPHELFDGAALRRVYYKILVDGPTREDFVRIFLAACKSRQIDNDEAALDHLLNTKYPEVGNTYSSYHAPFLIDQMVSICEFEGRKRMMSADLIDRAWENLFVREQEIAK